MGLSHEKMVHLSHVVTNALGGDDTATFLKPHNQVRVAKIAPLGVYFAFENEEDDREDDRKESKK